MKKYYVVMNPVSGTIKVDTIKDYLEKYLKHKYTLYVTTGKERVPDKVRKAIEEGAKAVIAIGGDGTLSDCAEGVIQTKVPLVIVPTGTANNLAKELGTPLESEDAIKLASRKYKVLTIDAMKVKDKYYFLDISIGAKSVAIRDTSRKAKLRFGLAAYAIQGVQSLFGFRPSTFFINADGKVATYPATEVVIANAGIFGISAFRYSNEIKMDDGTVNICIIRANSLLDYLKIGYRFFRNTSTAQGNVQFMTAVKKITITSATDLPVQADGEIIAQGGVKITVVPQSLRVAVPQ